MRIAHVNLAKGFRGGERQTALLIEGLAARSNLQQVLVCRTDSPLRERLAHVANLRFVAASHQLAGHVHVRKPDIVHAHEAKAVHWAALHRLVKGTPYILTRRVDTPVKEKAVNRWCYRRAACRVAISRTIQRHLEARGWGDVKLIPSAFSGLTSSQEATKCFRAGFPGKFLVGHAGALVDRHKGQRVLLKAARILEPRFPEMHFVFLGDGEDREALQHEASDLSNVTWLGFKENVADYLAGLDVFAFPSRNEGLGSVLLDVMDAGIPVVASNVGGIPDIVEHDETGLLIPNGDADALSEALVRLYRSPGLRDQLCRSARESLQTFCPESMADSYFSLYQSILRHEED
ncbi:glycosyltransferase family 4 protein [Billgrantia gudaonensis]|uniref:Glycosyltransferase involved in cell wall bisynthesis n=1 Tax=Billgrantia gudaonensis TaxID=376427 RepID=A0A1G8PJA9_9GAMM|nr:glycosyltransferase family 4 protein [Halomonas gudaonensis]SDI92629.1 Glycosyltransferase involved in cell wall bisynthesis [Halomonas gudaonensis]